MNLINTSKRYNELRIQFHLSTRVPTKVTRWFLMIFLIYMRV
jgi:hypothetical protein